MGQSVIGVGQAHRDEDGGRCYGVDSSQDDGRHFGRRVALIRPKVLVVGEVQPERLGAEDCHRGPVLFAAGGDAQKKKGMEALEKSRKRIQGLVGRGIVLKFTPKLRFILDESIERGNKVLRILDELEKTSSPE